MMEGASKTAVDFGKKAFVLVTGASKGIGRTVAVELARHLNQNSIVTLLARSEPGLEQTKSLIQEIDKSLNVLTFPCDLAKADAKSYETILDRAVSQADTAGIEYGIIVHNAGSLGEIKQTTDLTSFKAWRDFLDLNVISVSLLNSVFVRKVRPVAPQLVVVNMTSLCGRTPFMNLAMYGSGKAARELFFKVFALEQPSVAVLNYSPGPVQTDMFDTIIDEAQSDEVKASFKKVKDSSILTPEQTVGKLLSVLEKGDFKSGDTVDYFDRV